MIAREFVLRAQRTLELTDGELARLCGTCRTAVVNWRSGRHEPSGRAVLAIVDRLVVESTASPSPTAAGP